MHINTRTACGIVIFFVDRQYSTIIPSLVNFNAVFSKPHLAVAAKQDQRRVVFIPLHAPHHRHAFSFGSNKTQESDRLNPLSAEIDQIGG